MKRVNAITRNKRPESFAKTLAKEMLDSVAEDPTFIKYIIIGNETAVYEYHDETVQ